MDVPSGFQLYEGTGLYYQNELAQDAAGRPVQRVTYFDPSDGSTHVVDYPAPAAQEAQPPVRRALPRINGAYITMAAAAGALLLVVLICGGLMGWFSRAQAPAVVTLQPVAGMEFTEPTPMPEATPEPQASSEAPEVSVDLNIPPIDDGTVVTGNFETLGREFQLELFDDRTFDISCNLDGTIHYADGTYIVSGDAIILTANQKFMEADKEIRFVTASHGGIELSYPNLLGTVKNGDYLSAYIKTNPYENPNYRDPSFPYLGTFSIFDEDIEPENRPYITMNTDRTFYMWINRGGDVVGGSGVYSYDAMFDEIAFIFDEMDGLDPGETYRYAQVKIVDENTLYFITDGFGLMGRDENYRLFRREG